MRKPIIKPTLSCLLVLGLATAVQAQNFFNAVTNLGPVGYWPLNETTAPPGSKPAAANAGSLGTVDNGAYTDGAIPGTPGALAGDSDGSCLFSGATGVNPMMAAPFDAGYAGVTHFTIEAWVNSAITDPGTETVVGCLDVASPRAGWLLYAGGSGNGAFNFRAYNQNGTSTSLNQLLSVPGGHTLSNTWYHVAVTFDGTHAVGYINGQPVTNATLTGSGYVPSTAGPFTVGARSDGFGAFPGYIDEVALYSTLLSASDILAHYRAGTNPAPATSYYSLVTNDNPLLYYRLGDGGAAVVARNFGNLGTFGNGYYESGTTPGATGPDYPGMGANNFACSFAGSESADIGPSVPVVGLAGLPLGISNSPSSLAAWIQVPSGSVGYFETVLGKGDQVYRFDVDSPGGAPHWNAGTDSDLIGNLTLNDGNWHYWVGAWDGTNQYLYIDGALVAQNTPNPGTGGNLQPFLIGTAPDDTGRNFNGNICQVALFDKALTAAQVQTVYFSAGGPPVFAMQPQTTVAFAGSNVSLTISAVGKQPLSYQWFKGSPGSGTPASGAGISGANTPTLLFTAAQTAAAGNYYAVVTDNAGLTNNSVVVTLTVLTTTLPGTYFPAVVNLNPLGYWPLNENVLPVPSPVATNYGTLGSAGIAAYSSSGISYAQPGALTDGDTSIATDGTAGVVTLPFSPVLSLKAPFSAEAWLNTTSPSAELCPLSCVDANSPRSGWLIYMDGQNPGSYNFRMYNQNGTSTSLNISSPANAINAGEWHHVVVVYDGTTGYIYVDGQLGASGTPTGFVPNDSGPLTIGARSDDGFYFQGGEDEVAIYTNALSAATILAHYQAGTNASPSPTYKALVLQSNPILYYRLDEPTPVPPPPITSDPVAKNYGGLGANDDGYYLPGSFPGTVPGPQFPGLPSSLGCKFVPAYGGYVEVPQDANNALDLHTPMTVTAWIQANQDSRFESFLGRGDNSYRMSVDGGNSGALHWALPVGEPVGSGVQDDTWHFVAGTWDGNTMSLYIDGVLNTSQDGDSGGWAAVSEPFTIGVVPDYVPGRLFNGNMAQVAVFGRALSEPEIEGLYNSAQVKPYIITQPAGTTYAVNSTATVSVIASGTPALGYQWYEGTTKLSNSGDISGVTTPTLTISPAQLADTGNYQVVITNAYGAITSTVAAITIVSGPVILPDLPPTNYVVMGTTATLSVGLSGTAPFENGWTFNGHTLSDGGRISGTQTPTLTIADVQPSDAGNYQFSSTNSLGVSQSSVDRLIVETVLGISSTNNPVGSGWTPNGNTVYTPSVVNGVLTMTTAKNGEATSFFFNDPVYIGAFVAKFTYQDVTIGGADGLTFCLQNDARGVNAVGGGGNQIGYSGITPSAAIGIEVYTGFTPLPIGWQYVTGGTAPANYNDPSPVTLGSGDPINWTIAYDGNNIALTMVDVTSNLTYNTTFAVGSLSTAVSNTTALIGFTAATGGVNAQQNISNFSYIPLAPMLAITPDGSGGVFITWPALSSYALQKNASVVNPAGWTSVAGPYPTVAGPLYEEYQVHVTPATGTAFYRIVVGP